MSQNYSPKWTSKTTRDALIKFEKFGEEYFQCSQTRRLHSKKDIELYLGNTRSGLPKFLKDLILIPLPDTQYIVGKQSKEYLFSWNNLLWCFIQANMTEENKAQEITTLSSIRRQVLSTLSLCCKTFQTEKKAKLYFDLRFFEVYNSNLLFENAEYIEDISTTRLLAAFQNKAKVIKARFFKSHYDVDADACAYSMTHQHLVNFVDPHFGIDRTYPTYESIYKNKKEVRQHLSEELQVSVEIVKEILASILFSANLYHNPFSGVHKILVDNWINPYPFYQRVKNCALIQNLIKELKDAWPRMFEYWDFNNKKKGKEIFRTEKIDKSTGEIKFRFASSKFRARIYFELERKMLNVIRSEIKQEVLHLMHDGFICKIKPDLDQLQAAIKKALNMNITFSIKQF